MTPEQLNRWKNEILARLDALKSKARQARQYLEANKLLELKDRSDVLEAWRAVEERFPDDFNAPRASDLVRHLHFAMPHDFSDIEELDIPAIESAIARYGRKGDEFIKHELQGLETDFEAWELLHPQIRDACLDRYNRRLHRDAARAAVELLMDELRRFTGRTDDGDILIRNTVNVGGPVTFSSSTNDNERAVTDGLKLIIQGVYKGIRNPSSHGYDGFSRLETFQILTVCSFLLTRMRRP